MHSKLMLKSFYLRKISPIYHESYFINNSTYQQHPNSFSLPYDIPWNLQARQPTNRLNTWITSIAQMLLLKIGIYYDEIVDGGRKEKYILQQFAVVPSQVLNMFYIVFFLEIFMYENTQTLWYNSAILPSLRTVEDQC